MTPRVAAVVIDDAHKEVQQRLALRVVLGVCVTAATVALVAFVANMVIHAPSTEAPTPAPQEDTSGTPVAEEAAALAPVVPTVRILETPTGWLNVRAEPALDGAVVTRVKPGEEYPYEVLQGGWYRIVLPDGSTGWVIETYAAPVTQE
jgi:uncharacterized protein YgiM (DUF1202 family)